MKYLLVAVFSFFGQVTFLQSQPDNYPVYKGSDLGLTYTPQRSVFKIWAPEADSAQIQLTDVYEGNPEKVFTVYNMTKAGNGAWVISFDRNLLNWHYVFRTRNKGAWGNWVADPYAKAVTVNGEKGAVIDITQTNPPGWEKDKKPTLKNFTDIILYELHIRDFSIDSFSFIENKGKYLAFTENVNGLNNQSAGEQNTGLGYIKDLGVTHIHLLPSFDFASVDETRLNEPQFNWGYDPKNYNVPEGSYASNPYDPATRITEYKRIVQSIHASGLRVVMDVVYNHTFDAATSNFEQLVPGYFYRINKDGSYSNASGCGNETASEKEMMRKFIVESVCYWAKEYHIDGFRFDLMGIHDMETMKQAREALHKIDSTIFIYGEGWTAGGSTLDENLRLVKKNIKKVNGIAAFCDDMRDGIKGPWNDHHKAAFVGALSGLEESIKFGIAGATYHPQVDYNKVNYSKEPWAAEPSQCINYVSCHDDHTLWDKLFVSNEKSTEEERIKMDLLAQTIVLTSQGVPFLHAGEEFLRTKQLVSNSYKSPDSINALNWRRASDRRDIVNYYKRLIRFRKDHPAFRMPTNAMIQKHLEFLPVDSSCVVAYILKDHANGDKWKDIVLIFNGNKTAQKVKIPSGSWRFATLKGGLVNAGEESPETPKPIEWTTVPGISCAVLFRE